MPNADPEQLADPERLNVLRTLFPARGTTEPAFDRLASLAARLVKAPIGVVTLVDIDRMTFAGAHGLTGKWPGRAIWGLSHSYCPHVIATREPLVIDDARKSALVRDCDALRDPGFTAYLGVPLTTVDGFTLAVLAVADRRPRRWSEEDLRVVSDIAECAVTEIHLRAAIYADSGEEPVVDTGPLVERTADIRALDADSATKALLYQRLAQIGEPLLAALTSTSDVVWVADPNGDLLYVNPAAASYFAVDPLTYRGTANCADFLVGEVLEFFRSVAVPDASRGGEWSGDLYLRRHDGAEIPMSVTVNVHIPVASTKENWSVVARDITALRDTEQSVLRSLEREQAVTALQQRFITTMSHEFRTPLSIVLSSLEMLQRHGARADPIEHYQRMRASVRHISSVLDRGVQMLEDPDADLIPSMQRVSLPEFAHEHAARMHEEFEGRIIHVDAPPDMPAVRTDTVALGMIVENLLSNALKFSTTGTVVTFKLALRGSGTASDPRLLAITVRDHGIGIPEDAQPYIFERFFRAYNLPNVPGIGAGLYTVKRLVERLQGRIEFYSRPGEGTEFITIIPVGTDAGRAS